MEGIDKHSTWWLFMTSSMHAAIFLGKDDSENLHIVRNTEWETSVQKLFDVTQKLIREQKLEILGVSELRWRTSTLEKLSLVNDEEVVKLMKAKVYVFSDSVLCFGKVLEYPQSNIDWENKLEWFKSTNQYRELDGIDGEPVELEWRIFPGHTTLQILQETQGLMRDLDCEPEQFPGRMIFLSKYNDIEWRNQNNERVCLANASIVGCYAKRFPFGSLVSSRIRFRNEMECDRLSHAWRSFEQSCRTHDAEPQWKWSTDISCHQRIGPRSIEKQRRWKIIQSLLRGWSNHWDNFTHCYFCQSAQYLRGCPRFVWRILSTTDRFRENFCSYGTIRVNGSTYWFVEYSKTASNQWARTWWPIA